MQGEFKEDSDCCKDGKVSSEKDLNSENGEVILKDSSDDCRNDNTSLRVASEQSILGKSRQDTDYLMSVLREYDS